MKQFFYLGIIGLALFEILNVYFIMPMPGSQEMDSIDLAYFLYSYRWFFRVVFLVMILMGVMSAFRIRRKLWPALALLPVLLIIYAFNFKMTADHMFLQPQNLAFKSQTENKLEDSSLVLSVSMGGESKAYPIRYIQYHHQVRDQIGGKPVMVTYCNVCRTGRVYEPVINGREENFRLVGMDHFNAMFEDHTTKSWWRQATGQAVTGTLKGQSLPEIESDQFTLKKFFEQYPGGKVMDAEMVSKNHYDSAGRFEKGKSKGQLTRTDSTSWQNKSWILGVMVDGKSKAYDWIELKRSGIINDTVGVTPIVVAIAADGQSFAAFKRSPDEQFMLRNDSLISVNGAYDFAGHGANGKQLAKVKASQEFLHSWKEFSH